MSIGNVSINVGTDSSNYNSFYGVGYPDATAAARFTGMNILSGVHAESDEQINAVNDRFDVVDLRTAYVTAQTNLVTAQTNLDDILGDNDPAELLVAVTTAETALGTEDDPATEEVNEATGARFALANAVAAVDAAQKVVDDTRSDLGKASDENVAVLAAKTALGAPADGDKVATGAYKTLADKEVELAAAKNVEAYNELVSAVNTKVSDLGSAIMDVTDAEADLDTAITKVTTASDAHLAAQAAQTAALITSDGVDADEYTAAFIADRMLTFDYPPGEGVENLGRMAYIGNAILDAMPTAAVAAWGELDKAQMDTQGYESYNLDILVDDADDAVPDPNNATVWRVLGRSDPDAQLKLGMDAWIADFIDTVDNGVSVIDSDGNVETTTTLADIEGNNARDNARDKAEKAYDAFTDDAMAEEAGRNAYSIEAARDAAEQTATMVDDDADTNPNTDFSGLTDQSHR